MKPYEYQEKVVEDTREAYRQGVRRPMIQLPCGGGKTFISNMIFRSAIKKNKKVLFLCDKIALCEQAAQSFSKLGSRVAIIQQGRRGDSNPEILVASVQSIEKLPRLPDVDLIIRDEAHVLRAYDKRLMETYNNVLFAGLSATPWSKGLGKAGYYETIIKGPSTSNLIELGRLTPSDIWEPSAPDLEAVGIVAGEYNQKQLGEVTAKRVGEVVDQFFEICPNDQTMISAINCADSINIVDRLVARGVKAYHVDYKTPVQKMYMKGGIIDMFKAGELQVLSSVFKLSIGIDLPNCTKLIFAAPTKSLIRHIQFWGRGIRSYPGKEFCTIIDMAGNRAQLGFNTDETTDELDKGDKPISQRAEYEKKEPAQCSARDKNGHICGAKKEGSRTCPKCGFTPTPEPGIEYVNGKLVRIQDNGKVKKKLNKKHSTEQKRKFYAELKGYAESRSFKDGWSAHKYKERYGVWPNHHSNVRSLSPSYETMSYIKHLNIKNSQAPKRAQ